MPQNVSRRSHRATLPTLYRMAAALMIVTLAAVTVVPQSSAAAQQEDRQAHYNQPVTSQITDAAPEESWQFNARGKGDRIVINVDRLSGTLVPSVELRDDDENVIASANHDSTYAHAGTRQITLPAQALYHIVISRYQGKDGKTSGQYKLLITLLGIGENFASRGIVEGVLKFGVPRTGEVTNAKWQDIWAVEVETNNPITITATRSSNTLIPNVMLLDDQGRELASVQADEPFTTATISNYSLPGPGQYLIVVFRADRTAGSTIGAYELVVTQSKLLPVGTEVF